MAYFVYPYLITLDDTMAYGSHHFITNFKFQCAARESLLYGNIVDNQVDWRDELPNILMLTPDGYTRNMSPVPVGEMVIVFMTFEAVTTSSLRLCFRTISYAGEMVACGYQSIACIDKEDKAPVPLPKAFTQFQDTLQEPRHQPSFQQRALEGGQLTQDLFSPELLDTAQKLARLPAHKRYPHILN